MHFVKAAMVMAISLGLASAQGPRLGAVFKEDGCGGDAAEPIYPEACVNLAEKKSINFIRRDIECLGHPGPNCQGPPRPVKGPENLCLPVAGPFAGLQSIICFLP
ncbi:hypothetical protein V495_02684 [Pseudogymnoascus sp. VKM F-4514 (FW-929)]|nr:hypothetical protein V495_02684 [Pseudogymnoascus sp. VKM F-4514 (FW-929)]KFY53930.1 hypothetical protein V497_08153 [Pseudogymnoascus sp. VKM F-4516 (FW-969)]